MDEKEIALEMLNFLNETGQYGEFLNWAENRGFDIAELETDLGNLEE